jgi:hypothetical protein
MEVSDILNRAVKLGACNKSAKATDWKSLVWLFFSPQGIEFCKENNYPSLEMFCNFKDEVRPFGVYVNEGVSAKNKDVALIGNGISDIYYNGVEKAYKVILMHDAFAHIHASNYAVVKVENLGGCFEIINDGTAKVLL